MLAAAVTQPAPAKINLALHVIRRREDGYHDLESLVVFAAIGDELSATEAQTDSLSIVGPFAPSLPSGPGNLVLRAVAGFRERWPDAVKPQLALQLTKNLPVAAGIGGGSADAAAALRLMASLAEQSIPLAQLQELAARLGADVPACLVSSPLVMRGIGEQLSPLPHFPDCHIVLVNPLVPLSTPDVFRRLSAHDNYPLPELPEPLTRPAQLALWLLETRNDLQPPATKLLPVIGEIVAALAATQGCILARMSGAGATCFGLFGSAGQAHQAAQVLRAAYPDHWVAASPLLTP